MGNRKREREMEHEGVERWCMFGAEQTAPKRKATYVGGSEEPLALRAKLNGYPREQDSPGRGDGGGGRRGRGRVAAARADIVGR